MVWALGCPMVDLAHCQSAKYPAKKNNFFAGERRYSHTKRLGFGLASTHLRLTYIDILWYNYWILHFFPLFSHNFPSKKTFQLFEGAREPHFVRHSRCRSLGSRKNHHLNAMQNNWPNQGHGALFPAKNEGNVPWLNGDFMVILWWFNGI